MSHTRPHTVYIKSKCITQQLNEFYQAVYSNDLKKSDELARRYPNFVNSIVYPIYDSALSRAILKKDINYSMLKLLIKHGVDLEVPIGINKMNPLEVACKNRNYDLCFFLINNGANKFNLTPHYLLSATTDINYFNLENVLNVYHMIKLFGGLENIAHLRNGNMQSFKDCASKVKLQNKYGGSTKYNFWNLLQLAEELELEESLQAKSQGALRSEIENNLIPPLANLAMGYYLNSAKHEINLIINAVKNHFSEKMKTDEQKLGQSYLFFRMGAHIIPEYDIPRVKSEDDSINQDLPCKLLMS